MANKTTRESFPLVEVKKFEFSHCTANGNGVYRFIIQTEAGDVIEGKTQPGMHQSIGLSPTKLADVEIDTTASGRVIMKSANRVRG
jgi:hypothetical protein